MKSNEIKELFNKFEQIACEYEGIECWSASDYITVYNIVKKLQQDIYTDAMFPNDLRPKGNHGYKTTYNG